MSQPPLSNLEQPIAKFRSAALQLNAEFFMEEGREEQPYRDLLTLLREAVTSASQSMRELRPTLINSEAQRGERFTQIIHDTRLVVATYEKALDYYGDKTRFPILFEEVSNAYQSLIAKANVLLPGVTPLPEFQQGDFERAIILCDLVGYTDRVREQLGQGVIEEESDPGADLERVVGVDAEVEFQITSALGVASPTKTTRSHILRFTGDGALLQFETISLAAQFLIALRMHQPLHGSSRGAKKPPFQYRAGIASGLVRLRETQTSGLPLIRAARMESGAPKEGGIAIHAKTFEKWRIELEQLKQQPQADVGPIQALFNEFGERQIRELKDGNYALHITGWQRKHASEQQPRPEPPPGSTSLPCA